MYGECMNTYNRGNGCNTVVGEIEKLSPEGQLKLIRRGRDVFNKNKQAQLEMLATMINGGLIHKQDLC